MAQIKNASVQYNDLIGSAALDFHGGYKEDLLNYAIDMGINIERYHPIGLSFYIGEQQNFYLKFMCIDNIIREEYQEQNEGKVPVIIFNKEETLQSFLERVKRFEVVFSENSSDFVPHSIHKEYNSDDIIE